MAWPPKAKGTKWFVQCQTAKCRGWWPLPLSLPLFPTPPPSPSPCAKFFLLMKAHFCFICLTLGNKSNPCSRHQKTHTRPAVHSSWQTVQSEGHGERDTTFQADAHACGHVPGVPVVTGQWPAQEVQDSQRWCMLRNRRSSFQRANVTINLPTYLSGSRWNPLYVYLRICETH